MRYELSLETAVLDAAAGAGTAEEYVLPRVQVFLDGVECDGVAETVGAASHDGRDHTRLRLDYECPGSPEGAYEIRYGVFADGAVVDDHTNVVRYHLPGASGTFVFDAGHRTLEAGEASMLEAAGRFAALGVEHILGGIDHVLFLVVLLLGASSLGAVVKLATAFTAAHSVTLALGALGWVTVPPEIVEPLIALSIAYVAAEAVLGGDTRHQLPIVFAFGLLHGLGFAGSLSWSGDLDLAALADLQRRDRAGAGADRARRLPGPAAHPAARVVAVRSRRRGGLRRRLRAPVVLRTSTGMKGGGMNRWVPIVGAVLATLVLAKAARPVIAEALDPQQATVTGVVYEDRNGNDQRDAGERGVRGVSVSDGTETVETDSDGQYRLEVDVARRITDLVFITKPAGYGVPTDQYKTPRFYRDLGQLADDAAAGADFALLPDPSGRSDDFTFANVADPHRNANMAQQMRQITETSKKLAFVQVSGDLTDNATDAEFMQYKTGTTASKLPVWPAVGNHEYFNAGPSTYAGADRQLPPPRGTGVVLVRPRQAALPRAREQRRGADRRAARVDGGRPRGARGGQARGRAHAHADERPVRLAVGLRRVRRPARAVRHRAGAGRPRALQRRRPIDLGQGRQAHPDELELVHDRSQPARLPLRDDAGPAHQQPVPDVRRRAVADRHQPGARSGALASRRWTRCR